MPKKWEKLKNKYMLKLVTIMLQMQEEFYNAKIKNHSNSNVFIIKLENLQQKLTEKSVIINNKYIFY